jgi:tetratricopeptide (TPR) repeat protein
MTDNRNNLSPKQLADQGKALYQQEEYAQAAEIFSLAETGFETAGDMISAGEMANNRSVALLQHGEFQAALDAVGQSDVQFADAGDVRRQAMAIGNRAAAMAELGDKEGAETAYWESARLLGEIGEKDMRASVLTAISKLQMKEGRYMEALASMESGLDEGPRLSFTRRILKRLIGIPRKLLDRE